MKIVSFCSKLINPCVDRVMSSKPVTKLVNSRVSQYYIQANKDASPIIREAMRGGSKGCLGFDNPSLAPYAVLNAAYSATKNIIKTKNIPGAFSAAAIIMPVPGSSLLQVPLHRFGIVVNKLCNRAAKQVNKISA